MPPTRIPAVLVVAAAVVTGCSANQRPPAAVAAPDGGKIREGAVPASLAGLVTRREDVSKPLKEAGDRAYVTSVALWSLRQGERLRATLQVARFAPDAPSTTEPFQRRVAAQIGGTVPRTRRVGQDRVFVSAGNRQVYYTWFRGRYMVLLSVPAETRSGRGLLRSSLRDVMP